MKVHTNICELCSRELEGTRTRALKCRTCDAAVKLQAKFEEDRLMLEAWGFSAICNPHLNEFKQRVWTVTRDGHTRTSKFNNIMSVEKKRVCR